MLSSLFGLKVCASTLNLELPFVCTSMNGGRWTVCSPPSSLCSGSIALFHLPVKQLLNFHVNDNNNLDLVLQVPSLNTSIAKECENKGSSCIVLFSIASLSEMFRFKSIPASRLPTRCCMHSASNRRQWEQATATRVWKVWCGTTDITQIKVLIIIIF